MTLWQKNASSGDPLLAEVMDHALCSLLPALVDIEVKGHIDRALALTYCRN